MTRCHTLCYKMHQIVNTMHSKHIDRVQCNALQHLKLVSFSVQKPMHGSSPHSTSQCIIIFTDLALPFTNVRMTVIKIVLRNDFHFHLKGNERTSETSQNLC